MKQESEGIGDEDKDTYRKVQGKRGGASQLCERKRVAGVMLIIKVIERMGSNEVESLLKLVKESWGETRTNSRQRTKS